METYIIEIQKPVTKRQNPYNHVRTVVVKADSEEAAKTLAKLEAPVGSTIKTISILKPLGVWVARA